MYKISTLKQGVKASIMGLALCASLISCNKKEELKNVEQPANQEVLESNIIAGKYIVVLNSDRYSNLKSTSTYEESKAIVEAQAQKLFGSMNLKGGVKFENVYSTAIQGFSAFLTEDQVAALKASPDVISIKNDKTMRLDINEMKPRATQLPTAKSRADYWPWGISFVGAKYGDNKTAWVIDSGIDLDHPDLNVDQSRGRNFCSYYSYNPGPNDDNGHGTHVAGTIAAKYNGIGVVGVAANATVVPIKVVNAGGYGTEADCAEAVDYVAYYGKAGEVVNMSLGYSPNTALDNAVRNAAAKGIKFAIAAGNESSNAYYVTPARVVANNVYKVCAINSSQNWASFSNYGSVVDWAAPGVGVWSTYKDGGYSQLDGTSMASPHVAGMLLVSSSLNSQGTVRCPYDGNYYQIADH